MSRITWYSTIASHCFFFHNFSYTLKMDPKFFLRKGTEKIFIFTKNGSNNNSLIVISKCFTIQKANSQYN